jgi:hypothetical protein
MVRERGRGWSAALAALLAAMSGTARAQAPGAATPSTSAGGPTAAAGSTVAPGSSDAAGSSAPPGRAVSPGSTAPPGSTTPPGSAGSAGNSGQVAAAGASLDGQVSTSGSARLVLAGYVEANYAWNFNQPSNGVTNFRGFDNRHNTFTLSNAVLDATFSYQRVSGRVALQVGNTPDTYVVLSEPTHTAGTATGHSDAAMWRFVQQALVGYRAPLGAGLLIELGVFLSPVGPETMAARDSWNWSRSNLFFGLPFYHTGLRVTYPLSSEVSLVAGVVNGWNSVVDNNDEKSVFAQFQFTAGDRFALSVLYFGGVERPTGAPEGRAWRNLFDAYMSWAATGWFSLGLQVDGGFEPNAFGTSSWLAGALTVRARAARWLYFAARVDGFLENVATDAMGGRASPIFWPAPWVSSQTATVDVRPMDNISVRLEYRHDHAGAEMYYAGAVRTDPVTGLGVVNARAQDTLSLGATAWF